MKRRYLSHTLAILELKFPRFIGNYQGGFVKMAVNERGLGSF